jgi:hypothetical protein
MFLLFEFLFCFVFFFFWGGGFWNLEFLPLLASSSFFFFKLLHLDHYRLVWLLGGWPGRGIVVCSFGHKVRLLHYGVDHVKN